MKKSQNFLLPLIALDALVFLFVGCAALPAALRGHAISGWLAFACVVLLLAAMAAMLVPYVLEYKKDIAAKHEHTEEARKNFEIIFDELAALRLALADLVERVEKDEDNAPDRQKTERDILELKTSAKEKSAKDAEFKASVEDALSKLESSQKNAKASLGDALAEIESKIKDSESAADAKLEKCGAALAEIEEKIKSSDLSGSKKFEEFGDALAEIKAQIAELSAALSAKEEAPQEPPAEPRRPKVEVGHLLKRALQNAEESKQSVGKFISLHQEEAAPAEAADEAPEEPGEPDGAEGTIDFSDDVPEEETSPEQEELAKDETDSSDFFEPADSPEQVESAEKELASPDESQSEPQSEPQAETQAEAPAPEPKEDAPQKSEKSAEPQAEAVPEPAPEAAPEPIPETAPLFEDLPVSRGNIKPKKGDAVIVVNALIGIGNKPYLRGDGAGLSTQKGTQMEYLEIGKWRYVLPDLDAPLNFTVLRNDETPPQGQSQFTIGAGEKMELNLFFPLERETF